MSSQKGRSKKKTTSITFKNFSHNVFIFRHLAQQSHLISFLSKLGIEARHFYEVSSRLYAAAKIDKVEDYSNPIAEFLDVEFYHRVLMEQFKKPGKQRANKVLNCENFVISNFRNRRLRRFCQQPNQNGPVACGCHRERSTKHKSCCANNVKPE